MVTLYQHPVSPFCITVEAILRYAKSEHRVENLPYSDRRVIVEKTKGQYYKIPLLQDGETVVWDTTEFGQNIARYLDDKFKLALFPQALEGIQSILARYIEQDLENISFKLNDIHYESCCRISMIGPCGFGIKNENSVKAAWPNGVIAKTSFNVNSKNYCYRWIRCSLNDRFSLTTPRGSSMSISSESSGI